MNKPLFALFLGPLLFACTASPATFDFSYSVQKFNLDGSSVHDDGTGTLTATFDSVHNDYLITAISGTTTAWGAINGLQPVGSYQGNDNLLSYPGQPYLDGNGISFTVQGAGDDGSGDVNLFQSAGSYYEVYGDTSFPGTLTITPAVSGVPEPTSAALLLLGFGGIGATFWCRRMALRSSQE